jgi:hypothetical protein
MPHGVELKADGAEIGLGHLLGEQR